MSYCSGDLYLSKKLVKQTNRIKINTYNLEITKSDRLTSSNSLRYPHASSALTPNYQTQVTRQVTTDIIQDSQYKKINF